MTKELQPQEKRVLTPNEILINAIDADPKLRKEFEGKYLVVQNNQIVGATEDITPLIAMNKHLDQANKYYFRFIRLKNENLSSNQD